MTLDVDATHTRTHVCITFANPYLACDQCRAHVVNWHNPQQCGCDESGWQNQPCGHQATVTSACPSWGPTDGCRCLAHLGHVPHGSRVAVDGGKP